VNTTTRSDAYLRIAACRGELLLDAPFFGTLALKLALVEDHTCDTFWTNGTALGFNPAFAATLSKAEVKAVLAHEVMHCALGHPWRRGARDMRQWNIAADYALNPLLVEAGFQLPACALVDEQWKGKTADWIYDRLPSKQQQQDQQQPEQQGGQGQGSGDGTGDQSKDAKPEQADEADAEKPGDSGKPDPKAKGDGMGECRDAPEPGEASGADNTETPVQTEADWQQARDMAEQVAASRGNMPGGLRKLLGEAKRARVDWRAVLRRYVQQACAADYSWTRPNRRYIGEGYVFPSLHTPVCGRIVVGVDTSSSIDDVLLQQFAGELRSIAQEVSPESVEVLYCHTHVYRREEFPRGEDVTIHDTEGGGTSFEPVFNAVEESGDTPTVLIYLTDLYGSFPDSEPDYPVVWAVTGTCQTYPWGEYVPVE